jgi:hypothetical protein
MSRLLVLPTPLLAGSLSLGQLIADPLNSNITSFKPSSQPPCHPPQTHRKFQSTATHDDSGRFLSTTSQRDFSLRETQILVNAETSTHTSLSKPRLAFNELCQNAAAQLYLRKSSSKHRDLYYVAGIQTLKNPSFMLGDVSEETLASAPARQIRLPMHVKRVDSAFGLPLEGAKSTIDETIFAVELWKVRCRVGLADEPHGLGDIDYAWSYYKLEDSEMQLSIGLGKALRAEEMMALAGMDMEREDEMSWDPRSDHNDGDEGIGGF